MDRLLVFAATGCYSGMIPFAPRLWGTAAALIPWFFCRDLELVPYLLTVAGLFTVGALVAGSAEKIFDRPDPPCIVIDEAFGLFVTLTLAPNHPAAWIIGFLLFLFYDEVKPFPVSWLDTHMHGGIGIMMDDALAGLYGLISLQLLWLGVTRLF